MSNIPVDEITKIEKAQLLCKNLITLFDERMLGFAHDRNACVAQSKTGANVETQNRHVYEYYKSIVQEASDILRDLINREDQKQ